MVRSYIFTFILFFFSFSAEAVINQNQYNQILNQVYNWAAPIFQSKGQELRFNRNWSSDKIEAEVKSKSHVREVIFHGGLPRHLLMTYDAYTLVACHEIGHFLGGAPQISLEGRGKISIEGAADYYANLKCSRQIWNAQDTRSLMEKAVVPSEVLDKCYSRYHDSNSNEYWYCVRALKASIEFANLYASVRQEDPVLLNQNSEARSNLLESHPSAQCRMETLREGVMCDANSKIELDQKDPKIGSCSELKGDRVGNRPKCWYVEMNDNYPKYLNCTLKTYFKDKVTGIAIEKKTDCDGDSYFKKENIQTSHHNTRNCVTRFYGSNFDYDLLETKAKTIVRNNGLSVKVNVFHQKYDAPESSKNSILNLELNNQHKSDTSTAHVDIPFQIVPGLDQEVSTLSQLTLSCSLD